MKKWAPVMLAAALVAGCSAVPTSGPVNRGPVLQGSDDAGVIRVIARPPVQGMDAVAIVRGFLAASASLADVSVARQYLTTVAAKSWNADQVSVVRGVIDVTAINETSVTVGGVLDGVVDSKDRWKVAAPASRLNVSMQLTKERGQWRIASLPNGLIISRTAADRALRSYDVYYFDPSFRTLVPEPVAVPVLGAGLATKLIRRLLEGPSDFLAPSVATAFPEGTRLALESVPVINGVARVELTQEVLTADDGTRQALSAQIVRTLAPVPGVSAVRITVEGTPLPVTGTTALQSINAWAQFGPDVESADPRGYAVTSGNPTSFDLGKEPKPAPVVAAGSSRAVEFDISDDSKRVAVVSERRDALLTGTVNGRETAVYRAANLASPQVLRDAVWVVQRGVGLISVSGSGAVGVPVTSETGESLDTALTSVRVSRDRTRVALIVRQDGRARLLLARIENVGGTPKVLGAHRIENTFSDIVDVAWASASRLSVIVPFGAGSSRLVSVPLGLGATDAIDVPAGTFRVAAAPGKPLLIGVVTTGQPAILMRAANRWSSLVAGTEPVYP